MRETSWRKTLAFGVELPLESQPEKIWTRLVYSKKSRVELFEDILSTIDLRHFIKIGVSILKYYKKFNIDMDNKINLKFDILFKTFIRYWIKRIILEYEVLSEDAQNKLWLDIDKIIKICQEFYENSNNFKWIVERLTGFKEELLNPDNN